MIADGAPAVAIAGTQTWRDTALGHASLVIFLTAIAARNGGYFPTAWGWATVAIGWFLVMLVVFARDLAVTRAAAFFATAAVALGLWTSLSIAWSDSPTASVLEAERMLVYLAAVVTVALGVRTIGAAGALASVTVVASLICGYGLATRMFPGRIGAFDPVSGYRLAAPVGYWNALGLVAAIGAILAIGFLAHGGGFATRSAAAAALVVFAPTMYLTFSRGAWLALIVGLLALIALDPARLNVCLAVMFGGMAPLGVVAIASHSSALSTLGADVGTATRQGHRLLAAVVIGAVVAGLLGAAIEAVSRNYRPGEIARRIFAIGLVLGLGLGVAVAAARFGSPWHLAAKGWRSFTAPPSRIVSGQHLAPGTSLNGRLFQLSNNNRIVGWKSALHEWESSPVVGRGAGSFEGWWLTHRPRAQQIRDAHSLYLESLSEIGIVGLALVVVLLGAPLVFAWRHRRTPYAVVGGAALVAWCVHAGFDWDWEVPGATLPALICGVACCSAGRVVWRFESRSRLAIASVGVVTALFGIVVGIGNQAVASSRAAIEQGNYANAAAQAARATRWAPWLSEPWVIRGQMEALNQDHSQARSDFRKAIAKDPRNYLAWYGLAGVTSGAAHREAVAKVVELNPLSDEAKELSKRP